MQRVESMLAEWRVFYDRAQKVRERSRSASETGDWLLVDQLQADARELAKQGEQLLKAIHDRISEGRATGGVP